MSSPKSVPQPLTREKAERLAWELYSTDEIAVVELLLLADDESKLLATRFSADQALELFRPTARHFESLAA